MKKKNPVTGQVQGCYSESTYNTTKQETMKQTNQKHNERVQFIKTQMLVLDKNHKLIQIKECRFDELAKNNPVLKRIIANKEVSDPLCPRDALFGGRTNAFVLYYK